MKRAFRCFAWGGGTEWQALCIDLDIAVQGTSFEEVEASLATAIEMYLDAVSRLPSEEQARLLSRRVPWHVRVGLASRAWLYGIFGGERPRGFTSRPQMPAPA